MDTGDRAGDRLHWLHETLAPPADKLSTPPQIPDKPGSPTDLPNVPHFTGTGNEVDTSDHVKSFKRGTNIEDPKRALSAVQLDRDFHNQSELGSQKMADNAPGSTAQQDVGLAPEKNLPYDQ